MRSKVYVELPKAGLGNKMLPWSRAYVFAQLNGLEIETSSWFSFFWGAWLRREKKKRLYSLYFKKRSFSSVCKYFLLRFIYRKVDEPGVNKIESPPQNTLYCFSKLFRSIDWFQEVRPYKNIVKEGILELLTPAVRQAYEDSAKPVIGIHVRRGDFNHGSTITPVSFFVEVINEIRRSVSQNLPVTVFTDAESEEIKGILELPEIELANKKPDIVDLLLLSDSAYLVTSIGSTFSYWAGFLSSGVIIKPQEEWQPAFRSSNDPLRQKELQWTGAPVNAEVAKLLETHFLN